ncbi:hypothetical protein TWF696_001646 [Orbilia brochopaga]
MNYLTYVERNAENLRFYLWIRQYVQRFDNLTEEEKALAPAWEGCLMKDRMKFKARTANQRASGVRRQPFRDEVDRIVQTFLVSMSPFELNLSSRDRNEVLDAIALTTHPSAFNAILPHVESSLRQQSHPNFIRHALSTAGDRRIRVMRWGGILLVLLAVVIAIGLSLGHVHKAWRIVVPSILLLFGICSILDGQRSVCLVLMAFDGRDRLTWEDSIEASIVGDGVSAASDISDIEKASIITFDMFDGPIPQDHSRRANIPDPEKKTFIKHILMGGETARGIDPEVKRLQRLIVLQNFGISSFLTILAIVILALVPSGNLY